MIDPLMHHDVVDCGTLCWVVIQNLSDQVASIVCDTHIVREVVRIHTDPLVGGLDVRSLERRLANDQRVNNDADRPDIDFVRVTLFTLEHLRGDVVRRTADGSLTLTVELELGGETEVTDFYLHLVVEEEVTELQISVNHSMTVQVLHSCTDLVDVALHFEFVESLTTTEQLVERLVLAQLEENVDVLCVLEEVFKTDDVVLVEGAMDFDFGHQLLLGSSLRQGGLSDDLRG